MDSNNKGNLSKKNIMPKGNYNKIYNHAENKDFKKETVHWGDPETRSMQHGLTEPQQKFADILNGLNYDGTPSTDILYYKIVPAKYGYDMKGKLEYKSVDISKNLISENSELAKVIVGLSRGDVFEIKTINGIETGRIVFVDKSFKDK